jgi:hypothetical protein
MHDSVSHACLSLRVGELFSTHKSTRQRGGPGGAPGKRSSTVIPMAEVAEVQIEGKPMRSDCISKKLYLIVLSLCFALDCLHSLKQPYLSSLRVWPAGLPVFHVCVFLLFMPYIPSHIISPPLDLTKPSPMRCELVTTNTSISAVHSHHISRGSLW